MPNLLGDVFHASTRNRINIFNGTAMTDSRLRCRCNYCSHFLSSFFIPRGSGFWAKTGKANHLRSSGELIICSHFQKLKQNGKGHFSHLYCRKVTSAAALVTCNMFTSGAAEGKICSFLQHSAETQKKRKCLQNYSPAFSWIIIYHAIWLQVLKAFE